MSTVELPPQVKIVCDFCGHALEGGENILPGIILEEDDGIIMAFRILCDGLHDDNIAVEEESDIINAILLKIDDITKLRNESRRRNISIAPPGW